MIKKRLRVSPGSWLPFIASLLALITAGSFAVFFRVTMEQARFVPRILNPQADIDGKAVDTLQVAGWGLMIGGLVLMALLLWFAAKKALAVMAIPSLMYAVGAVLCDWKDIQSNTGFTTERWIILGSIIVVSCLFIWVVTNLARIKEVLIGIGFLAIVGVVVLTFLQRAPFIISDANFTAKNCLDLTRLIQIVGYFLSIIVFSGSLTGSYQADTSSLEDDDAKKAAGDGKPEGRTAGKKGGASEQKSDGKTVNWALIRPTDDNAKKDAASAADEEPVAEVIEEAAETAADTLEFNEFDSPEETNRKIAEMTENGPTFEEEMNLVGEIGERKDAADAKEETSGAISSEPGVEVIQYEAPKEETSSEEKTLAQLLAERGLLNRTGDPIEQADAIRADNGYTPSYSGSSYVPEPVVAEPTIEEPVVETVAEETVAEAEEVAAETIEEAKTAINDIEDSVAETVEETEADTAKSVEEVADAVKETAKKAAEGAASAAAAAGAATAFSTKHGRKTVFDEMEEQAPEEDDTSATAFAEKGRSGRANRVREAAEKIVAEDPMLTVPVTPVSGSRLQKVLKEEIITDRDQKLMYRRKVSVFAVIGMCLSVAALVVGVLTTFDVVKIDMLKDEKTCLMLLGLGLVMFLVFGTRLTYKDYYTKTVVNERKVVHEESNWEEYVANRLEEDEKNIATLAQNYMRMTEMYGRLLETTAELTNNIKALSMNRQASIEAAEIAPEVEPAAADEPIAEEPIAEEPIVEEPIAEAFAPIAEEALVEPEPEKFAPFDEVVEETAAEASEEFAPFEETVEEFAPAAEALEEPEAIFEPAAAEITEAVEEIAEPVTEEIVEATEEVTEVAEIVTETAEAAAEEIVEPVTEEITEATEEVAEVAEEATEEVAEVAEEATEAVEEVAKAAEPEEPVKKDGASANADILAALFSGRNRKATSETNETKAVTETAPAESKPAAEEVKKEETPAEEAKPTGSYNDFLISTLFGRRKEKPVQETTEPAPEIVEEKIAEVAEPATEESAETVEEAIAETTETVEEAFNEIPETIEETAAEATEKVEEAINEIPENIEETAAEATETGEEAIAETTETVEEAFNEIPETVEETAAEATETVEEAIAETTETVEEAFNEIPETIEETAAEATETVEEAIADTTETVEEAIADTTETVEEAFSETAETAEEAIADTTEDIEKAAEEIAADNIGSIADAFEEAANEGSSEVAAAIEGIEDAADNAIPEYIAAPQGTTSDAVKAVTDSIQEPTWRIPSPVFGAFGYGATLAEEESEVDSGDTMKLQFSSNTMEEPMFNDEPMQNVFTPAPAEEQVPVETYVAEEPVAEAPIFTAPIFEEPVVEEPVTEEPVTEETVTEEPIFTAPIFEEPATEEPVVEEPVTEEPVVEEPIFTAPTFEEPAFEEPSFEEPAFEEPVIEETPAEVFAEEPITEEPSFEEPITEEPVLEATPAEEPAVEETPVENAGSTLTGTTSVPEWKPTTEQKRAPFYRPSIYGEDSLEDAVNNEEMPKVSVPQQREPEQKKDDGIIEGFVMPTFRGFTYSDEYEPTDDDTEEQMYNGSYKMKSFLARKTAQNEQMQQYLYDSDDDDDFSIETDDTAKGSQYHGAEIPAPAVAEEEGDMFAEPELPMTEADFAEPELPELESDMWAEEPAAPAMPTWNPYADRPSFTEDPVASVETPAAEAAPAVDAPAEAEPMSDWRPKTGRPGVPGWKQNLQLLPEDDPFMDDMFGDGQPKQEEKPAEVTEEDERTKVENRRKMLQEKLEQIRKKNLATQFDDLSDLDDEGVFFNKK